MKNPLAIKAFGIHLRQLREEKGLSQQELADLSDIAKKTITRIENGNATATNDIMVSISRGLSIHPKELLDFKIP